MKQAMKQAMLIVTLGLASCASAPQAEATPGSPSPAAAVVAASPTVPAEPEHPRTWAEVPKFYDQTCPGPLFTLEEPHEFDAGGSRWRIEGSTLKRLGGPWKGKLVIGVLGAVKDAEPDTKKNLQKAKKAFSKAKVNLIVLNGDVAESAEINDVSKMLAEIFIDVPVLVHAGNVEWMSSFSEAFFTLQAKQPNFFNGNVLRDVDLGGVHILTLPGWSNRRFVKQGGCHYSAEHVAELDKLAAEIHGRGELVILSAHGPPRGEGKKALDYAFDVGNVGDEALAALLHKGTVRFGLFSHILEAGGRATADPKKHKPLPKPMFTMRKSLFINAGSASSFSWLMHSGARSRGMAAIVTVDAIAQGGKAKVAFLKLR